MGSVAAHHQARGADIRLEECRRSSVRFITAPSRRVLINRQVVGVGLQLEIFAVSNIDEKECAKERRLQISLRKASGQV